MGKHIDKVGSYENFRAPWETEAGEDAEIDKSKLRRLIYNFKLGEAKALDSREEALESVKIAEAERDEAKADAAKASPDEANKKIERLEKEVTELKATNATLVKDAEVGAIRAELLGGLDPKVAKYVKGETREEIEKSLEDVAKDFGLDLSGGSDDDDDDEPTVHTRPKSLLTNPLDSQTGKPGDREIDFDKAAEEILSGSAVFR